MCFIVCVCVCFFCMYVCLFFVIGDEGGENKGFVRGIKLFLFIDL